MHIHLDTLGGISGNMFIAAILDAWPDLEDQLALQIEAAGFGELVSLENTIKNDGTFQGAYFSVQAIEPEPVTDADAHSHHHGHRHRSWSDIRQAITDGGLETGVKQNAVGIFQLLAEAEAHIHGKHVDEVAFHEVGAWDSIADIVCAAYLIDRVKANSWSVSSLPLARGTISGLTARCPCLPLRSPSC